LQQQWYSLQPTVRPERLIQCSESTATQEWWEILQRVSMFLATWLLRNALRGNWTPQTVVMTYYERHLPKRSETNSTSSSNKTFCQKQTTNNERDKIRGAVPTMNN
jgi:hypothetical protein